MATILVVDDDPQILRFLHTLLTSEGYQVATAANGQEGLAAIEELRPDLVISDVQMPVLSGTELLRAIRQGPQYRPIPVVLMSAGLAGLPGLADLGSIVLPKPLNVDGLLTIIAQLLKVDSTLPE